MDPNEAEARDLFLKSWGSPFLMYREGDLDRYKAFGISKEREREWGREERQRLLELFRTESVAGPTFEALCTLIGCGKDVEGLGAVIEAVQVRASNVDTYTLVLFAEGLISSYESFIRGNPRPDPSIRDARELAKALLIRAREQEFAISDYYLTRAGSESGLSKGSIRNRIRRNLNKLGTGKRKILG